MSSQPPGPQVQIIRQGHRSDIRFGPDNRSLLQCARCSRHLPDTQFSFFVNTKRRIEYHSVKCLRCQRQLKLEHARHPLMTPEIVSFLEKLARSTRSGAKPRGIVFAITVEDLMRMWIEQGGRCALSGMPLSIGSLGIGRMRETKRASVDRKSSLGNYTPDNVHLVCQAVNIMKNDMTMEEFGFWCQRIVLHALKQSDAA